MSNVCQWLDDRTGLPGAWRGWLRRPVGGGPAWRLVWPATVAFVFFTQVVTGLALWMYYSPGAQSAWESVYYLQYHVQGGWLLRAVHHYAAQVMLVLVGVWLVQMIFRRTYRPRGEVLYWTVVLMGLVTLALNLTGDLLAWDQNGYWNTRVRTMFLLRLPLVGPRLFELAAGGPDFGHLTLTRFLALHAGVFSALFGLLLWLYARLARRQGIGPGQPKAEPKGTGTFFGLKAEKRASPQPEPKGTVPFSPPDASRAWGENRDSPPAAAYWPRQALRDAAACLAVMAVVLALALQHGLAGEHRGVALGPPADPAAAYPAARPEWSFRGLYQLRDLFPTNLEAVPVFVIPGLVVLVLLAMPWIGRTRVGHWCNVAIIVAMGVGLAVLSWISLAADARDKDYQESLAAAGRRAERVEELIAPEAGSPPRIPPGGALVIARREGWAESLFAACASCHEFADGRDTFPRPADQKPTAPDLYRFAGRGWLSDFLDPKQISGPRFFGNTKFRNAVMPSFVKRTLAKLDDKDKEDLRNLIAALSAEAALPHERELDARDAEKIHAGQAAFGTFGCTDCHKFRHEGRLGTAPDLTGYGSRSWLVGIISDPAHRRFYGSKNDRMPAYAAAADPAKNLLSDEDIGLLADWLREQ
jgi:ubiquinol-cytochrome c reductase cytochrome b subunit